MNAVFDTLKAVKALKEAGFDDAQAEALVQTVGEAVTETVATKADLTVLQSDISILRSEHAAMEARIHSGIAGLKADIYKQLWVMGAGITAVTVMLNKIL